MSPNRSASPDVFVAVGDRNRRRILELLAAREHTVGELTAELGIAQPSVSQHLALLREVGLVSATKVGTSSRYRLERAPFEALTGWLAELG